MIQGNLNENIDIKTFLLPALNGTGTFRYYVTEEKVNNLEFLIAFALTRLDNVLWWHRNRSKKEFCLNGFINHYPDFIVLIKSSFVLLIETKGDDRDNSASK